MHSSTSNNEEPAVLLQVLLSKGHVVQIHVSTSVQRTCIGDMGAAGVSIEWVCCRGIYRPARPLIDMAPFLKVGKTLERVHRQLIAYTTWHLLSFLMKGKSKKYLLSWASD